MSRHTRLAAWLALFLMLAGCAQPTALPAPQETRPSASPTPLREATRVPTRQPTAAASLPASTAIPTKATLAALGARPTVLARGEITGIAASPDGRWLAVASLTGAYLHSASTLAFERALLEGEWVLDVAFSPDSARLAAVTPTGVRLLEVASGQEAQFIQESAQQAVFTPDGGSLLLLTAAYSPVVVLLREIESGVQQQLSFVTDAPPESMALSPDGRSLALGGSRGPVELFDFQTSARLAWLDTGGSLGASGLAFSPDGSALAGALSSAEGRLLVWSVGERKRLIEQYASGYYAPRPYVAFSADGKRLVGGNGDLALAWERPNPQPSARLEGYASRLFDLAISPDGAWLAYATQQWTVVVRSLSGAAPARVLSLPYYMAMSVNFSPSGEQVAVGQYSYAPEAGPDQPGELATIWATASGERLADYPEASAAAFYPPVGGQPAQNWLALADSLGRLRVVDLASGSEVCLPGCACQPAGSPVEPGACRLQLQHGLSPMKLGLSPDGGMLSAWGVAGSWSAASLLDLASGAELTWFRGGSQPAFSSGGWLALGVAEINSVQTVVTPTLAVYSLAAGRLEQRIRIPAPGAAALSPDETRLAVGISTLEVSNSVDLKPDEASNGLLLFDTATWEQLEYIPVPYGILRLAFTPGGEALVTAGETGQMLLWSINK